MLFGIVVAAKPLKPVILVPGTYASVLKLTGNNTGLSWYCPKKLNDDIVWVAEKYFIPPVYNCLLRWVNLHYDPETKSQANVEGISVDVLDFGGLEGITYLDRFWNMSFISYYTKLAQKFIDHGYQGGVNLFGAPNDWRFGIANQTLFFHRMAKLVVDAYNHNNQTKVVIIGHSFGSFASHEFLTSFVSPEWCKKYIDHSVMLAPSFGGSPRALDFAWIRGIDYKISVKTKYLAQLIESVGAVHTHFPNFELSGDFTYAYGPDGHEWKAYEIPTLLTKYNKITGDNIKLLDLTVEHLKKAPKGAVSPEIVYYNSAVPTTVAIKIPDYNKDKAELISGRGDSTIMADTIEAYCRLYEKDGLVQCHDLNIPDKKRASHFKMILDDELNEMFYQTAIRDY